MHFAHDHFIGLFVAFVLFQNAVKTMPSPKPEWGPWYQWGFDFLHVCALDGARIVATRFPGLMPASNGVNGAAKNQ